MKRKTTFGVVHIGSIHTSVAIVAYRSPTDFDIIEAANKEIPLGEEIFRHQRLSFASIHELCRVLQASASCLQITASRKYIRLPPRPSVKQKTASASSIF